jgi:hypothetical protein
VGCASTRVSSALRLRRRHRPPVTEDYQVPFHFAGKIGKVAVRIGGASLTPEEQREFDAIRGRGVMAE